MQLMFLTTGRTMAYRLVNLLLSLFFSGRMTRSVGTRFFRSETLERKQQEEQGTWNQLSPQEMCNP